MKFELKSPKALAVAPAHARSERVSRKLTALQTLSSRLTRVAHYAPPSFNTTITHIQHPLTPGSAAAAETHGERRGVERRAGGSQSSKCPNQSH